MATAEIVGMYTSIIALISMTMLLIILITYLASKVLKLPSFEAWFNVEISEFFASFLVMLFAIGFFEVANAVATSLAGGGLTAVDASTKFIKTTLGGSLEAIRDVTKLQVCISTLSTFARRTGEFTVSLTYKLFPGLDNYLGILNILSYGLALVFGSLNTQLVIFQLIDATMVRFFLPAGIILRFFQPTREAGMFLIAFAIGFQAVFPLVYVINQQVMEKIGFENYHSSQYFIYSICGTKYFTFGLLTNPNSPLNLGGIPVFGAIFRLLTQELGITMLTPFEFQPIMESIANFSLPAFFMPAFSITVTFAFISVFMKFVLMKIS